VFLVNLPVTALIAAAAVALAGALLTAAFIPGRPPASRSPGA
jgi:hypothetical protein